MFNPGFEVDVVDVGPPMMDPFFAPPMMDPFYASPMMDPFYAPPIEIIDPYYPPPVEVIVPPPNYMVGARTQPAVVVTEPAYVQGPNRDMECCMLLGACCVMEECGLCVIS